MLGNEATGHKTGSKGNRDVPGILAAEGFPTPAALAQMVEGEIIPRLLLAHRNPSDASKASQSQQAPSMDVKQFAMLSLENDAYALLSRVEGQIALGVDVESLFIDLLAPAARQLGMWWEDDTCDFVDVTMGLWRLQEVAHEISARVPGAAESRRGDRSALFATAPGSQHAFGALLVEEFFRRAGWSTWSAQNSAGRDILDQAAGRWFDIVALTVTTEADLGSVAPFIAALRAASRNAGVIVMVGGWVFNQNPALVGEVGADCTAPDARAAVLTAERLLNERVAQSHPPVGNR